MIAARLLVLLVALSVQPTVPDAGGLTTPGTPAGEPAVALGGLRVARETLTLDLRRIATGRGDARFASVEAVYGVVNDGPARQLPIEVVAVGPDAEAGQVWVDERPVAAQRIAAMAVPALWTGIETTRAVDGDVIPYAAESGTQPGLRFVLDVGPGAHRIRVRTRVQAGAYDGGDHPNRTWQVAYSLAPARLWAGFAQLDLTVLAPAEWDVATSIPVRPDGAGDGGGERYTARFAGLPGDILTVAARAPEPAGRRLLHGLAFLAALVVAGVLGALGGVAVGRTGRAARWALPASLLGGVGAAASLIVVRSIADGLGDSVALGYGAMITNVVVLGPAVLLLGTAVAQLVAVRVARRVGRAVETAPGAEIRN